MKIFSILTATILLIGLFWQQKRIDSLKETVQNQKDSIETYHLQKLSIGDRFNMRNKAFDQSNEPEHLKLYNDSLLESHRILQGYGNKTRVFRVEVLKDSTIRLTFKVISIRNPLTGKGKDSLYKTQVQQLNKNIWYKFKNSISNIDSYDLTYWDGTLDCFGGELFWEAWVNHSTYHFGTHYGQARQFTKACEIIMREVRDKELEEIFKEQDKRQAEALNY